MAADANGEAAEAEAKTVLNLDGLADTWERVDTIREYLRQQDAYLFSEEMQESVKQAVVPHIKAVLMPLAERMARTEGAPQPLIDPLKDEILRLYRRCGAGPTDAQVHTDAWYMRKLLAFLKMKCRKKQVSNVARPVRCL